MKFRSNANAARWARWWVAAACVLGGLGLQAHAQAPCEGLPAVAVDGARVVASVLVSGPSFTGPDGATVSVAQPFCKVSVVAQPVPDSLINIELWLPIAAQWNGRLQGIGNGGYAGTIAAGVPAMLAGLKKGDAVATTDMGTAPSSNGDGTPLYGHPQKWVDWGSRSTHLMTVVAKSLVSSYYGRPATHAYFNGCSTGGGQALMEAQRYPEDYDGILAGAPASNRTHGHVGLVWNWQALRKTLASNIIGANTADITAAVLAACTVKSGGVAGDPFLTDPRGCDWDPGALLCTSATQGHCLNADQVAAGRKIYDGTRTATTNTLVFPGFVKGSENDGQFGWAPQGNNIEPQFDALFKWVFGLTWNASLYDFDTHTELLDQTLAGTLNANSTDLSAFRAKGGKLIAYHGWQDPLIPPQTSINTFKGVVARTGGANAVAKTQGYYRLFMVPGMGHCSAGTGPDAFGNRFSGGTITPEPLSNDADHDILTALERWVEQGKAPERITAARYVTDTDATSGVRMTRPLCVYPRIPRYIGTGSTNDAANFSCVTSPYDGAAYNPVPAAKYLQ